MRHHLVHDGPTRRFTAVIGFTPGYSQPDDDPPPVTPTDLVDARIGGRRRGFDAGRVSEAAVLWQHHAAAAAATHGVEPSAVVTGGTAAYPRRFGCPTGGEPVLTFTGNFNPAWKVGTADQWEAAVLDTLRAVAEHYDQTTFQVAFDDVDRFAYFHLDPEDAEPRRG